MDISIKPLTPELAADYVRFFDETPHNKEGDGIKCYCVTWRSDDSYVGDDHWYPMEEERRERALGFAHAGKLQGYLAYCGDKIIGWCNVTGDCMSGVNYLRSFWPIPEYGADVRVKSVFCFMIAPEYQHMGIATRLLEQACADAAVDGYDFVEAYIYKDLSIAPHDFRGPLELYLKCGFDICAERDNMAVVRKVL